MRALLIKDGKFETIDTPAELKDMQKLVAGYITTCFTIRQSEGHRILGWCDDEFLIKTPTPSWNVLIGDTLRTDAPYPIGGPILILGCNAFGNNEGLTEAQIACFELRRSGRLPYPVLNWRT